MALTADLAQTFFIDPTTVRNSRFVNITSIDLFFGKKPTRGDSSSNLPSPGVTVFLTPTSLVEGEIVPNLGTVFGWARKEYDDINISSNADTPTIFTPTFPPVIKTGVTYAIVIKFDGADTGFALWRNKASETIVDSNLIATPVTKSALDGKFFVLTNGTVPTPLSDTDLKIKIKLARYTSTSKTYRAVNRNFEFMRYNTSTLSGNFQPGELAFANTGFPSAQTVSVSATSTTVTGTSTTFLSTFSTGDYIVLNSNTVNEIKRVSSISNNTVMEIDSLPKFTNTASNYLVSPIGRVFDYMPESNTLVLVASTANSTNYFAPSQTIHGEKTGAKMTLGALWDFPIHAFNPDFKYFIPPGTSVNTSITLANSSYNTVAANTFKLELGKKTEFRDFGAYIFSRSNEVQNDTYLDNSKSVNFNITLNTDNPYASPIAAEGYFNMFTYRYNINNSANNEHKSYGAAKAKHITRKITLADGQDAEDLRVYITAFKPQYTDIKIYAKLHNSLDNQPFDDKDWSLLEQVTSKTLISNASNPTDYLELEFKLPNYPIANSTTGSAGVLHEARFAGADGSAIITGSTGTVNTHATANIQPNDLVRIYDPLTPNNSLVAVVSASNTTTFTIDTALSSSNTYHANFISSSTKLNVERITFKNVAFNNYLNSGVVRYYDSNMGAHDAYKVFALKVVMLSSNDLYRPSLNNIRAIALTA